MQPDSKQPTIVTIIPYYNGSATIERAIKSVLNQTVPANEFIIVNDGSRDDETKKLHEIAAKYNVIVLDKENGGQGSARNAGVWASSAEYICFLDQDDFYFEEHNQVLLSAIPENLPRFGWAYADLCEADIEGNIMTSAIIRYHGEHPKTSLLDILRNNMNILPSASIISRKAFTAVDGFDEQFTGYEDDDLFLRMYRKGFTNHFIDQSVTAWCQHPNSTSYSMKMCHSRFNFFKKLLKEFPDDWTKGRFYLRDYFIPRFHDSFMGDPMMSVLRHKDNKIKLYEGYEELMQIFREYLAIVSANESVSPRLKRHIRLQFFIISTRSPSFVRTAIKVLNNFQRMKRGVKKLIRY